nr:uncharacterized protein LOC127338434 [Lolium perenne]
MSSSGDSSSSSAALPASAVPTAPPPFIPPQLAAILAASHNASQMAASTTSRPFYLGSSQFASGFFPTPPPYAPTPIAPPQLPSAPPASLDNALAAPAAAPAAAPPASRDTVLAALDAMASPIVTTTVHPAVPTASLAADGPGTGPYQLTHLITVRLTQDNYLFWRAQILPLLRSRHLEGFVDGSHPCPPRLVPAVTATGAQVSAENPAYRIWVAQDQAILSALQSSLTEGVTDLVEAVRGRETMSPRDLYSRLLSTKQRVNARHAELHAADPHAHAAYRGAPGGGYRPPRPPAGPPAPPPMGGGGRPPSPSPPPRTDRRGRPNVDCQLCGIHGHYASRCHRRFKRDFLGIGNDGRGNEKQAAIAEQSSTGYPGAASHGGGGYTPSYPIDPAWYFDTGATDHMTNEAGRLHAQEPYRGRDQVRTADGSVLIAC